jgi:hypothetical protein
VHARPTKGGTEAPTIDEDFKNQLLARLTTESQVALATFIESEVFKTASEKDIKSSQREKIAEDNAGNIRTYQLEMDSWRRNANVNLIIGLICALMGIGVMWQTLISLTFDIENTGAWRVSDFYRFVARFGLVVIIESVAFFFLKLYREDRNMIRYLRNEITNLELKAIALRTALAFGTPADITKILQSLMAVERNFLVKKGERIMSDVTYENSEIMIEKILSRPDFVERMAKLSGAKGA